MFMLETHDKIDDTKIGGIDYIDVMPRSKASHISISNRVFNHTEMYYKRYTIVSFNKKISDFLRKYDKRIYVEKKMGIMSIDNWISSCKPFMLFDSVSGVARIKLLTSLELEQ